MDVSEEMARVVALETVALLAQHGVVVARAATAAAPTEGRMGFGAVGFGSAPGRGGVAFMAPVETWRRLAPRDVPHDEGMLADVVGEMTNMLLGRVKRRLLPRGLDL